ncbi:MAG TPA: hypothetical protein VIV60_22060, partial [Polyangiaceae bacterium]
MNKIHDICWKSLLGIGALGLPSCQSVSNADIMPVETAKQALTSNVAAGVQPSVVVFRQSDAPAALCTGVVVGPDVVLTSSFCATKIAVNPLYLGTVGTLNGEFVNTNVTVSSANILNLGSGAALIQVRTGQAPSASLATTVATGIKAAVSGVNSTVSSAVYGQPVVLSLDSGLTLPSVDDGVHLCAPSTLINAGGVDDGAPVFFTAGSDSGKLAGVIDSKFTGCEGAPVLPITKVPKFGSDTFATGVSAASYTAVLGGDGPIYELAIFLPAAAFGSKPPRIITAGTGIPKGLATALGVTPKVSLTSVVGDKDADGVPDIEVTVGSDPRTLTTDVQLYSNTSTDPHTLRTDLGTVYRLSGADIVGLNPASAIVPGQSWKGIPSADERDGRFIFAGAGFGTAQVYTSGIEITGCSTSAPAEIWVYDPDTDSTFDSPPGSGQPAAKSCIALVADTNDNEGDGNETPCGVFEEKSADTTSYPTFVGSAENGHWYHVIPTCGAKDHYRLYVSLTQVGINQDCAELTGASPPVSANNGFKVRANCQVANTLKRTVSFGAVDTTAFPFDAPSFGPPIVEGETSYDMAGTMPYLVDMQAFSQLKGLGVITGTELGNWFALPNADADDCDYGIGDGTGNGCYSAGQEYAIHFLAFGADKVRAMKRCDNIGTDATCTTGVQWSLLGGANGTAISACSSGTSSSDLCAQNPSGNFQSAVASVGSSGVVTFAVLPDSNDKSIAVLWRNLRVNNLVAMLPPHGSPIVYPVLSSTSKWISSVDALTADGWLGNAGELAALLPIEVGKPGARFAASTVTQANALLSRGDLVSELAAMKLNIKRVAASGLALETAVIRSSNVVVTDAISMAENVLSSGGDTTAALTLLRVANQSLVTFATGDPVFPDLADEDNDGIANIADNCIPVANPQQENTATDDQFGDACDAMPIVECVVKRSTGHYTAFFGYNKPYEDQRLVNDLNKFLTAPANRNQPVLFRVGRHRNVFSVDFNGSPLTWKLAGNTVTASSSSPACTNGEDTTPAADNNVVLLASDSIQVGDRFQTTDLSALMAGANGVSIGFGDTTHKVGDIYSTGNLTMRDRVDIEG